VKTEHWCRINLLTINKAKSGILQIRVDRHTRSPSERLLEGISIVPVVKYLGLLLDDDLSFRSELNNTMDQLSKLKQTLFLLTRNIPGQNYVVWKSMIESKILFKMIVMADSNPKIIKHLRKIYYQLGKHLLNLKSKPSEVLLIDLLFGDLNQYLKDKLLLVTTANTLKKLALTDPLSPIYEAHARIKLQNSNTKKFTNYNFRAIIQYKLNKSPIGFVKVPRVRHLQRIKCLCDNTTRVSAHHVFHCALQERIYNHLRPIGSLDINQLYAFLQQSSHEICSDSRAPGANASLSTLSKAQ